MTASLNSIGTYCGVVHRHILVSTCPLAKRACMWQHHETQQCRYTSDELTPSEFAQRVGLPEPAQSIVETRKLNIKQALRQLAQES